MPVPIAVEISRVALASVPVAALALGVVLSTRRVGWPRWRPRRRAWHGAEAVPVQAAYLFAVVAVVQALATRTARPQADFAPVAMSLAAVAAFVVAWSLRVNLRGVPWPVASAGDWARSARLGAAGFLAVVVPTYVVHFSALAVAEWLGQTPQDHPMSAGPQLALGGWPAYAVALCLAAPCVEELVCRGIVAPWAAGRAANALAVFGVAALLGYAVGDQFGPAAVALVAAAGCAAVALSALPGRLPRRTLTGVLASAALFAALHANVWPTPVPLLVLACALGWVAARSGGLVAPAVLHMLFNAVAVVRVAIG